MRTFTAQKSNSRTLTASGCHLISKHLFRRYKAKKGNGVNTKVCADAMEAEITF
jgi:hypothetical protein